MLPEVVGRKTAIIYEVLHTTPNICDFALTEHAHASEGEEMAGKECAFGESCAKVHRFSGERFKGENFSIRCLLGLFRPQPTTIRQYVIDNSNVERNL